MIKPVIVNFKDLYFSKIEELNLKNKSILKHRQKENLWQSFETNLKKNLIWLLGEEIVKNSMNAESAKDLFWKYDLKKHDFKIDVKTIKTNKTINKDSFNFYKFYLQSKQVHEEVNYVPVIINIEKFEAIIYFNKKFNWIYIKKNYIEKNENPPFTYGSNKTILNYVIPYSDIIES